MTPDAAPDAAIPLDPAAITVTPNTGDLGTVNVGESGSTQTFTVENTGEETSGNITAVTSGANATDFVSQTNCATLAGGDSCTVTVTFAPSAAGQRTATLNVNASPGGSGTVMLSGTGNTPGMLAFTTPSSVSLGSVVVGQVSATSATFTVKNTGSVTTSALLVTPAGANPGEFTLAAGGCQGQTLAQNATCNVVVSFAPQTNGPKSALFTISDGSGASLNASVTGTGLSPAHLIANPTLAEFGTVTVGQSSGITAITLTNNGDVTTSAITVTRSGTDAASFSTPSGDCNGVTLAPGASCTQNVRFDPTTPGSKSASLDFTAATGGLQKVTLLGTGVLPGSITITPSGTFTFNPTNIGTTSSTQTFTITNGGGLPTSALNVALGGNNPGEFEIVTGANGCQGATLGAGNSCTVVVDFKPTGTTGGARTASLNVTAATGTATTILNGTAIAPAALTIAPPSRDFGSVVTNVQSSPLTFTVTNNGGVATVAPVVTVSGTNSSEFMASGCTTAIAANGGTCTVSVVFTPTTTGSKSAAVTVTAGTQSVTGQVSGSGIGQADIFPNPTVLTFAGFTVVGDMTTTAENQTFTVTNRGAQTTSAIVATVQGANAGDFSIVSNNCTTLVTNQQCQITVQFKPTATGNRAAQVHVAATTGGTFDVSLIATSRTLLEVTAPTLTAGAFNFNSTVVDADTVQSQMITVRNNDDAAHVITATIAPTTQGFTVTPATCGSVLAGDSCTVTVTFDPQTAGNKTATLKFTADGSTDANFSTSVTLNGTATNSTLAIGTDPANPAAPAATLTPAPTGTSASQAFGNAALGTSTLARRFYVANTSGTTTGRLTTTVSSNTPAGSFQIAQDTCAGTILADADQCFIDVVFAPRTAGAASGGFSVSATNALGGAVTATYTGTGITGASSVSPTALDFGTLFAGDTTAANTQKRVLVTNNLGGPETISYSIVNASGGAAYTVSSPATAGCGVSGSTLANGATCELTVTYLPTLSGANPPIGRTQSATLRLVQSGGGFGTITDDVSLTGASKSTLAVAPTSLTFSNQPVNTTEQQHVVVTNASPTAVTNISVVQAGVGPGFSVLNNTCATLAAQNDTCSFDLQYAPTAVTGTGGVQPTISVRGDSASASPSGAANIAVQANAISATSITADQVTCNGAGACLFAGALNFGSVIVGQPSGTRVITYRNVNQQTSGVPAVTLTGADAGDFAITANTCTVALAQNATCAVTVVFTPTATGTRGNNGFNNTAFVQFTAAPGPTAGTLNTPLRGTGLAAGSLAIQPTTFTFADTVQNSTTGPTQSFVVSNTAGTGAAKPITTVTTGNPNFTVVTGAGAGTCVAGTTSLASGQTCTVVVRFTPTGTGNQQGTLTVTSAGNGNVTAALQGRSLGPATVTFTVTTAAGATTLGNRDDVPTFTTAPDFGSVVVNSNSAPETVTLTNGGDVATTTSTVSVGGTNAPDFIVGTGCNNVVLAAGGGSCSFTIVFRPLFTGVRQADITIPTFAGFGTVGSTIRVSGTGAQQAALSISPTTAQDFTPATPSTVNVGDLTSGPTQTFTIRNNSGDVASSAVTFTLTGTDFVLASTGGIVTNPRCSTNGSQVLAGNSACDVVVRFAPTHVGSNLAGTLSFSATAGGTGSVSFTGDSVDAIVNNDTSPANFGSAQTGSIPAGGQTQSFTFSNQSESGTNLLTTTLTGTDFVILSDTCGGRALNGGASCAVQVRFVPSGTAAATRTGTLTVAGTVVGAATSDSVGLTATVIATP